MLECVPIKLPELQPGEFVKCVYDILGDRLGSVLGFIVFNEMPLPRRSLCFYRQVHGSESVWFLAVMKDDGELGLIGKENGYLNNDTDVAEMLNTAKDYLAKMPLEYDRFYLRRHIRELEYRISRGPESRVVTPRPVLKPVNEEDLAVPDAGRDGIPF